MRLYNLIDSSFEKCLLEKLLKEPPQSECVNDLVSGIYDMMS